MHRLILVFSALLCLSYAAPLRAQHTPQKQNNTRTSPSPDGAVVQRPGTLPTATIPYERRTQRFIIPGDDLGTPGDSLTEQQVLRRISRIYGYQADVLSAQANGDTDSAEDLLELAMTEMNTLLQQPEVMDRPRFRELYRTVLTEYERFYGFTADTLSVEYGEIYQFRADLFAEMNDLDEPLLEDVMLPELEPIETVFPMTMNRLVEQSIRYLKRSPERHLYNWLSRAETYFPMIEQVLKEEGVPDELKYLAMIESGLNPRARSWAQAGGMWQFITATGRAYGLETNSWVDERMDPEKATRAAARHLRDLHAMFGGDWQLALAGYNCSPARIKRAIARAEARLGRRATFWDIYDDIPKETRGYVPMFIATALVASNPAAFEIDEERVRPGPRYAYHYVPVHGMLSLDALAEAAGTDEATLRALNPELKRSSTPPSKGPYYVRIPLGTYERFAAAYEQLPKSSRPSAVEYAVRRGDSLGKIAKRYGVSVSALMRTNDLRSTTIHVGQRLVVPVASYEATPMPLASFDGAKALTVEYGERSIRPITVDGDEPPALAVQPPPRRDVPVVRTSTPSGPGRTTAPAETSARAQEAEQAEEPGETRIVYRVRRGDNLTEIARRYGVSVSDLRSWNNLRGSRLLVGQRLYLYKANDDRGGEVTTASAPSSRQPEKMVYRVRRGDTLGEIARKHGVSVSDLRRWNNIRGSHIRSGQRLSIYGGSAAAQSKIITYKVRRGDTLTDIARKHGVSIDDLKKWNSLRSNTIRTGQRLKIHS